MQKRNKRVKFVEISTKKLLHFYFKNVTAMQKNEAVTFLKLLNCKQIVNKLTSASNI